MGIVIKIAWRNLWRHKGKSLVVGSILFLGALLMTLGAGVITGMDEGLQHSIVASFSGDIVLVPQSQQGDNVFMDMMASSVDPLPQYDSIKQLLAKNESVASFLPIGKNTAMVLNDAGGSMDGVFIIGVDFAQYGQFFNDNLEVVQGSALAPGERGVLIATGAQKMLTTSMGLFFMPESSVVDTSIMPDEAKKMGDNLMTRDYMVFMGMSDDNTTTDVRLPIRGLVKYKSLNTILGIFVLMDIESFRQCMGYVSAQSQNVEIPQQTQELLGFDADNIEAMFGESSLLVDNNRTTAEAVFSARTTETQPLDVDAGTYNLVLLKLKEGVNRQEALKGLEKQLKDAGIAARPVVWHKSIGAVGSMAVLITTSLFVFVMLLFFVAIVIIINTLSMAALERTNEIGMMRAIGAQRGFIGGMFVAETSVLAAFFGLLGMLAGWIGVMVLSALKLTTKNDMIQLLYGGDRFHPFLTSSDVVLVLIQLALVAFLAVLYPMFVARSITPLDAISRE